MAHPDLGRFVRNESDNIYAGVNVFRIWIHGHHRIIHRVSGGDAALWQRCLVYMRNAPPDQNPLPPGNADFILGGQIWPTPTDWSKVEAHEGTWTYYWAGQSHKDNAWRWDRGVRVRKEIYANGMEWRLAFDDCGSSDGDYNDFTIEVDAAWAWRADDGLPVIGEPVAVVTPASAMTLESIRNQLWRS